MSHLVKLVEQLLENKTGFRSICDGSIDTTTASGEFVFNIFSALAQFERRLIQERTRAGLSAARARGKKGGRKPIKTNDPRVVMAKEMHKNNAIRHHKNLPNTQYLPRNLLPVPHYSGLIFLNGTFRSIARHTRYSGCRSSKILELVPERVLIEQ